ncbi:MAG TPA: glutathione S-transferase family protein [Stellaceae bacterium]|jgi:glutathione S-transferase
MATVEILGFAPSSYTRVARMTCEEKGVPYELKQFAPHAPEVLAIHPFGKIPALRHGDFTLCESKAIADYIDRAFDGPPLFPADPRERARAEQWVSIVNTMVDPVMIRTYLFGYFFPKTEDGKPNRAAIDGALPALREQMSILDKAVAPTGHLAGDRFSFADINLMVILYYAKMFPEGADALASAKTLAAYYERHAVRPSFKNTIPPPPPPRQAKG